MINILLNFGITQELLGLNDESWAYLSTDSAKSDVPQLLNALEMLIPKPCGHQLLRIGSDNDGGYLIPDDLVGIESCFSPGTANTKDFEDALVNRYKIKSYMCDYSSDLEKLDTPIIEGMQFFEKKWLDTVESDIALEINNWTRDHSTPGSDLILQMDIEGYEYKNIIHCTDETLKRFRIIVLEIHHLHLLPFSQFLDGVFLPAFQKLTSSFTCVHSHSNNCCPQIDLGYNLEIPAVCELTFLRNDRLHHDRIVPVQLPHPLDRLNDISKPALDIPSWSKKYSDRNEYLHHKTLHQISLLEKKVNGWSQ